ncbi:MAG: glycosyltransferase family 25 protein, partial [Saprospiraceae bacterium]|nr:glycosyltransferase family 25 protein [Saprospiraceae bacterium]
VKRELGSLQLENSQNIGDFLHRMPAVDVNDKGLSSSNPSGVSVEYSLQEHFRVDPIPQVAPFIKGKRIPITMTQNEVACALSHINVWKKIVSNNWGCVLIIEDDVFPVSGFARMANRAFNELRDSGSERDFDLLYFSYREVDSGVSKDPFSRMLFIPKKGLWWTSGYVVSQAGARKLLGALPVHGPIDLWLNLQFENLRVFATSKPILLQRKNIESDNSYSIVPVLAKLGVFDKWQRKALPKHARRPVFAIGMNKTGTTSLHFALTMLGYNSCHWESDSFSNETQKLIDKAKRLPFEAYTDVRSIVENYKELDRQYPEAVFILTFRNEQDWINSRRRHVLRNRAKNLQGAKHSWLEINVKAWRQEREKHHSSVLSYFQNRQEKLLILNICDGDEWEPLCAFLQVRQPELPFPHVDPLEEV